MDNKKISAIFYAVLAAIFYSLNMPASKILLKNIAPTMMASLLYLGAGIGIGIIFLLAQNKTKDKTLLTKKDLPYTIGMVVLDIAAPILLMFGLVHTAAANASLLNNFEIVATTIIALFIFKEAISKRLWIAIFLVTLSTIILSVEDMSSLNFSWGSLLVILATLCWGLENNCTRMISSKNIYEIVTIKGLCSGLGSMVIALTIGEIIPPLEYFVITLALGFVAYGLSMFFYIKAQNVIGAAKTSAYYAIAPFIGVLLSVVFLHEHITTNYLLALSIMIIGSALIVVDTLQVNHEHRHYHLFTHTHNGSTHKHAFSHSHTHKHMGSENVHHHSHDFSL